MNPFDYVNAINSGKEVDQTKDYNGYLINRHYSYFPDTVLLANELNERAHIDNDMQFAFLINTIKPGKRFTKWAKVEHDDDINAIVEYYDCNYERAKEYLAVLSHDEIASIKEQLIKGGVNDGPRKQSSRNKSKKSR